MEDKLMFERYIKPLLNDFEIQEKQFSTGDFGPLFQVEFNSQKLGGNIDFWGLGWLGIFVWDYDKEEELLNILLEPHEKNEKNIAFEDFKSVLTSFAEDK